MSGAQVRGNDVDVDLGTLFASILRSWKSIFGVALAVTALAFALAWLATPHYRAQTQIMIEKRESIYTRANPNGDQSNDPDLDAEGVTSQVELINSADLLKKVAAKLELGKLKEFDEQANMGMFDTLLVIAGLKSDLGEMAAEDRVLKTMREKLRVYRVENSRVIVVEFSSENPKLAASVPNAIAEAYLDLQQDAKLQSNSDATKWLEPEIADLRTKVKNAEARIAEFRAQSDLMIGQNNSTLAAQQLGEMSTELSRVRNARATAEANAQSLRQAINNGGSLDALPDVLASPLIQKLRERQVQLNTDIADLSTTLLEGHPNIKSARSQLADLDAQIIAEARKILQGLDTQAETSRLREQKLLQNFNVVKAESARAGDEEVELRALEREANAQREQLESYLARYREATSRVERAYLPADARIFSRAGVPAEPYFPKILPITGAAFVGSLLIMAIVTLLRELFSGRAMRPAQSIAFEPVERVVMPPVAEPYPAPVYGESVRHTTGQEPEPEEDMYYYRQASPLVTAQPAPRRQAANDKRLSVQSAAEHIIAGGASRAIFLSPEGDEGAASAVSVAREVSDAGLRVLLLDLTSSGAASAPMLDAADLPGITNLLASEAQFADVIHADLYSECHVIPAGTANPARAMRAADRLPIIMDSLVTAYDVVVVECGPADAEGIRRLVADGTQVLVSALELQDRAIGATAANLAEGGYEGVLLVRPGNLPPPIAPRPTTRQSAA